MLADLSIAWVFWFVIRWPLLDRQVYSTASSFTRALVHLPAGLRRAVLTLQLESEIACQRALRDAGLAE
jgi:hypothetical protein